MTIQQAIITLVSAIISGVLATIITFIINAHKEKIRTRQALVDDIFGYKYQLTNNNEKIDINGKGFARAMNRIVIVFNDEPSVLEACDKFYETLSITDVRGRSRITSRLQIFSQGSGRRDYCERFRRRWE